MSCIGSSTTTLYGDAEVRIDAQAKYMPTVKFQDDDDYRFAYNITIQNRGGQAVKLLSRRWVITDGDNQTREVEGDGVVGEQPLIPAGKEFSYTSYVAFPTPVGCIRGSYTMELNSGERFQSNIETFSMAVPHTLN